MGTDREEDSWEGEGETPESPERHERRCSTLAAPRAPAGAGWAGSAHLLSLWFRN